MERETVGTNKADTSKQGSKVLPIHLIRWSFQDKLVAFASGSQIHVVDLSSGKLVATSGTQHTGIVRSIEFYENYIISTADDKQIKVWKLENNVLSCISSDTVKKKATNALVIDNFIVFSDKFGDVHKTPFPDMNTKTLLLGHCSTITDMILSPNKKYLLTSDKDEKIRVSNWPDTYSIESFCLGSLSFVSKILIPIQYPHLLVSGGGDGAVRLWNYSQGTLIQTLKPSIQKDEIAKAAVRAITYSESLSLVAVLFEGNVIVVLSISSQPQLEEIQALKPSQESLIFDIAFDSKGTLWTVGANPAVQKYEFTNGRQMEAVADESFGDVINGLPNVNDAELKRTIKELSVEQLRKRSEDPEFKRQKH